MEYSQIMSLDMLDLLDILQESLSLARKNVKFINFSIFTSFPLFCFLVFYESILQKTVLETWKAWRQLPDYSYYYYHRLSYGDQQLPYPKWIQLCLLYLVPYHLLELFNMIMTVNMASKIYTGGEKPASLKQMVREPVRFKGPFITSIYVLIFSTSTMIGLIWIVTNYFVVSKFYSMFSYYYFYDMLPKNLFFDVVLALFHGAALAALLMKYLEWSAGWHMSLVISMLEDEEAYGSEAFEIIAYFSRGSRGRGLLLMLVFFVWGAGLRLPCLFGGCNASLACNLFTMVYCGLICLGNVTKWVACVVYFFDCKQRILEKKVDEEVGRQVKSFDNQMQSTK